LSNWSKTDPTESGNYIVKYVRHDKGAKMEIVEIDHYDAKTGKWYWFPGRVIKWAHIPEDEEEE
jgi:hypothetical protein